MDTKTIEINEYCDSLSDVKPHLDEAFENLSLREVQIKVSHSEANTEKFQKRLKKIMKYINAHGVNAEVEYK